MLLECLEDASSLIFPVQCETCHTPLAPLPPSGVCADCLSEIRLFKPPFCPRCGRTASTESGTCGFCAQEKFHFDRAYACASYEGKMKVLLGRYKFEGRKYLRHFFSRLLTEFFEAHLLRETLSLIAAAPPDAGRHNERGFDQTALLAQALGQRTGIRFSHDLLRRDLSGSPQSLLGRSGRRANVRGLFRAEADLRGENILLLDDILTTGQTASECARILKEKGAGRVVLLACARA